MKPKSLFTALILSMAFILFSAGCEKKADAKSESKDAGGTGPAPASFD